MNVCLYNVYTYIYIYIYLYLYTYFLMLKSCYYMWKIGFLLDKTYFRCDLGWVSQNSHDLAGRSGSSPRLVVATPKNRWVGYPKFHLWIWTTPTWCFSESWKIDRIRFISKDMGIQKIPHGSILYLDSRMLLVIWEITGPSNSPNQPLFQSEWLLPFNTWSYPPWKWTAGT